MPSKRDYLGKMVFGRNSEVAVRECLRLCVYAFVRLCMCACVRACYECWSIRLGNLKLRRWSERS